MQHCCENGLRCRSQWPAVLKQVDLARDGPTPSGKQRPDHIDMHNREVRPCTHTCQVNRTHSFGLDSPATYRKYIIAKSLLNMIDLQLAATVISSLCSPLHGLCLASSNRGDSLQWMIALVAWRAGRCPSAQGHGDRHGSEREAGRYAVLHAFPRPGAIAESFGL